MQQLGLKTAQALLLVFGSAFTGFNLIAFRVTRSGVIYYTDGNQIWFAIGLAMLASAYVIRNWNKL